MISILMPVKNAGDYLKECLDSILNQTLQDWELLAVDDHSEDQSNTILAAYAGRDSRVRLLSNSGTGIISALRLAYKNATGDYITRMDADDIMPPKKLELLRHQLLIHGKRSLAVGLVKYFSDTTLGDGYRTYAAWLNKISTAKTNFAWIYKECVVPSPAWMLHREDLDLCGAFESDIYPEDYDLAFRMRASDFKICPTSQVVHLWRDHPVRSSRTSEHYADNRFLNLKIFYFIKSDYNAAKALVLWGAGKKGKKIARLLKAHDIDFMWVTNNHKKIGHIIEDCILKSDENIEQKTNVQLIIAIAQPSSKQTIQQKLMDAQLQACRDYFWFC